jgi:hypothetical protein
MSYGRPNDELHPFAQLILNCIIAGVLTGITFAVLTTFAISLTGMAYLGIFILWLLACYGVWFIFIRSDNDHGSSSDGFSGGGGSSGSWFD